MNETQAKAMETCKRLVPNLSDTDIERLLSFTEGMAFILFDQKEKSSTNPPNPPLKSTKTALSGPTAPPVGGGVRAYITGRVRSRAPAGSLSSVHNGRSGGADAENPLGLPHRSTAAEARQPLNLMRYRNHVGSGMRPLRAAFTAEPDRGRIRSQRVPPTCDGPNFGGR